MVAEGMAARESAAGGGVVSVACGRAEVDMRAPFRSVREAVLLFGERVLAGEVYAPKLTQMRDAAANKHETSGGFRLASLTAELQDAKRDLEKAREEALFMANCLSSLREELEETKMELRHLKERQEAKNNTKVEMEDVKLMERTVEIEAEITLPAYREEGGDRARLPRKQRFVKFADPPSSARDFMLPEGTSLGERCVGLHDEMGKKVQKKATKKKPLIPSMGALFPKNKGRQQPKANGNGNRY